VPGFLSSRPNWLPPPPLPQASESPPFGSRRGTHLLAGERARGPIMTKGQTLWYSRICITPLRSMDGTNHKVHIYKEYHSVCPLVGIGTFPPPLSPASVPLPPPPPPPPRNQRERGGGQITCMRMTLGESQFRRLEKSLALCLLCGTNGFAEVSSENSMPLEDTKCFVIIQICKRCTILKRVYCRNKGSDRALKGASSLLVPYILRR
jgi:hypothetical protein